jgi:hypothetical protein
VCADTGWVISTIEEAGKEHTLADCQSDVVGSDVDADLDETDGQVGRCWVKGIQVLDAARQGFDRTEVTVTGSMMHGTATLAVLLIIDV